jgi:hypothetical protein
MERLLMGQKIQVSARPVSELARAYGPDGVFLGVVEVSMDGCVAPKRLIAQTTPT